MYVHVDRFAQFLQTQDPSIPQRIGPFCTIGRRKIMENIKETAGLSYLPDGSTNQTCSLFCILRASILKEEVLPSNVYNPRSFSGECARFKKDGDITVGNWTKSILKVDASSMISRYDIVETIAQSISRSLIDGIVILSSRRRKRRM